MRVPAKSIGIMQGRLLPPLDGRVQSFPREGWENEFAAARDIGYASVELTIEMASVDIHPIRSEVGRRTLAALSTDTGVALAGLCCDTFMEVPLIADDMAVRDQGRALLEALIIDCAAAELPMLELPMLGPNALTPPGHTDRFRPILESALAIAEREGIDILLESDLGPEHYARFLESVRHPRLGVNYDAGNSSWFGFHPNDEIPAYGPYIRNVHIKDCTVKDYSVPLGTGETDFEAVFDNLDRIGYTGGYILQAARQADDIRAAKEYLSFLRRWE